MWGGVTVVCRYRADTGEYVVHTGKSVNAAAAARGLAPAILTDTTQATTVIGKSAHALADALVDAGDSYLNGDIAGVFVVDEFIDDGAVAAVVAAIEEGSDSDVAFRAYRDREREVPPPPPFSRYRGGRGRFCGLLRSQYLIERVLEI